MKLEGLLDALLIDHRHEWAQNYSCEAASVAGFYHETFRVIYIFCDKDAGVGTQVQIGKHVARRECADEQFFGVPA